MSFNYDKYKGGGDYASFTEVGDSVVGVIKEVREGKTYNGDPCPELVLEVGDEGDEVTLTAGQVMLKAALAEKAPQVGDKIRVVYSGTGDSRAGRTPPKLFTVDIKPGPHELKQPAVADTEAPF